MFTINYILMAELRKIINRAIDAILPAICVNCGHPIESNDLLCRACRSKIIIKKSPRKIRKRFLFSATEYSDPPTRSLIKALKYKGIISATNPLSQLMVEYLNNSNFFKEINSAKKYFIVPVPVHFFKKWKRGFDHSELLAKKISNETGIPTTVALRRKKWTPPQNKIKNDELRKENVKNCFALNKKSELIPKGSVLIIFDDIVTSGATIKEAAKALRPLRPSKIIFMAIASR
ncbi:MAG: phosphoribosyltransferase family protein [Candidatus Colwellbacteria bacterium]|nr:hypothetical protein [Candidatus Colwellbacteria bacterium]MDD3752836.1 phosphoribosyltransferase family protein [Candidatus Colwellbacteria bacterium]MDD4818878.1 phosphoribosyltransferase family protein [Candidatus Colwellbacteria bacterium]